jgi:hypothetical protein
MVCLPNPHTSHFSFFLLVFSNKGEYNLLKQEIKVDLSVYDGAAVSPPHSSQPFQFSLRWMRELSPYPLYSCTIARYVMCDVLSSLSVPFSWKITLEISNKVTHFSCDTMTLMDKRLTGKYGACKYIR